MTTKSESLDIALLLDAPHAELQTLVSNIQASYRIYKLSKGNGKFRVIKAPSDELKEIQNRLLHEFFIQ